MVELKLVREARARKRARGKASSRMKVPDSDLVEGLGLYTKSRRDLVAWESVSRVCLVEAPYRCSRQLSSHHVVLALCLTAPDPLYRDLTQIDLGHINSGSGDLGYCNLLRGNLRHGNLMSVRVQLVIMPK